MAIAAVEDLHRGHEDLPGGQRDYWRVRETAFFCADGKTSNVERMLLLHP